MQNRKNKISGSRNRSRGYQYERTLTNKINELYNYTAWRLGAPQVHLPDILAVSNDSIIAIECKSTIRDICRVPYHQALMCYDIVDSFSLYPIKRPLIACKFGGKNKKEYIFDIPLKSNHDITCNRDGQIYTVNKKSRHKEEMNIMSFAEAFNA